LVFYAQWKDAQLFNDAVISFLLGVDKEASELIKQEIEQNAN